MTTQNAAKDVKKLNHSYIADKKTNEYSTVETCLAISHKAKHVITI